jgi:hypothetical protein
LILAPVASELAGSGGPMRALLISFLFVAYASDCLAYGAIARGYASTKISIIASQNYQSAGDADIGALAECRRLNLSDCDIVGHFRNTCVSVAFTPGGLHEIAAGENVERARQNAISSCVISHYNACIDLVNSCDWVAAESSKARQLALSISEPAIIEYSDSTPLGVMFGGLFRAIQIGIGIVFVSIGISLIVLLWILISVVSTTPPHVLKWRISLAAWILIPATPALLSWLFEVYFGTSPFAVSLGPCLWTDVFAALVIGNGIRRNLLGESRSPALLSLPLANFVFWALSYLAAHAVLTYGLFLTVPEDCVGPASPFSVCGFYQFDGFYSVGAILIIMIALGAFLPPNSNLIRANNSIGQWLRSPRKPRNISQSFDPSVDPKTSDARPAQTTVSEQDAQRNTIKNAVRTKREEFDL